MCLDILKQLDRSKILRIAADYFEVFVRAIREIDKILDDCTPLFLSSISYPMSFELLLMGNAESLSAKSYALSHTG